MDILKEYKDFIDQKSLKVLRTEFKKKYILSQSFEEFYKFSKIKFDISSKINMFLSLISSLLFSEFLYIIKLY